MVAGPIHLRQRARVSTAMRKEIALYKRSHPDASQKAIAGSFGVCQATVSRILKMKDKWADPGTIASEKYCRYRYALRSYYLPGDAAEPLIASRDFSK